jgi:pimeloyl-ACP methyl ester carboxylesterase
LHYVAGGKGPALVLLPGWPETWWEFHKIMPALATQYRVIAVDLRGMGGSAKPQGGYDKKNMAEIFTNWRVFSDTTRSTLPGMTSGQWSRLVLRRTTRRRL